MSPKILALIAMALVLSVGGAVFVYGSLGGTADTSSDGTNATSAADEDDNEDEDDEPNASQNDEKHCVVFFRTEREYRSSRRHSASAKTVDDFVSTPSWSRRGLSESLDIDKTCIATTRRNGGG